MKNFRIFINKFIYRPLVFLSILFFIPLLASCGKEEPEGTRVAMSYINFQGTKIVEQEAYLTGNTVEEQIQEVLTFLSTVPQKLDYQVPLSQGISVLSTDIAKDILVLNLSEEYKMLDSVMEILTRASLVKSLTQIEGIEKVNIHINGEPLKDSLDKLVGNMTADMFIDNAGEEISTYEKITIRLYFTNETGDALIAVERTKPYNTNISLDKFVVEELLKGPESTTEGVYPTINPGTKLISTYVKDHICYVNFDSSFLTQVYEVDTEIVIYSIVNSLCSLSGIDRVQIIVDGNTDVLFHGMVPLTTVFSRDLSYVQSNSK